MDNHTCKSDVFLSTFNIHPADRHTAQSSADFLSDMSPCTTRKCFVFLFHWKSVFNQPWHRLGILSCAQHAHSHFHLSLFIRHFSLISIMPSNNSTRSATANNMCRIAGSRVPADQTGLIHSVHTAASNCTKYLLSPLGIAESDIPALSREVAATELWLTVGERDVQNASLPSDSDVDLARY